MTTSEYETYQSQAIPSYARDKKQAENISDEAALKLAQKTYLELLPQGLKTPHQFFYSILLEEKVIGMIWLAQMNQLGFIYDFLIDEAYRGQGLGKQSLILLQTEVKKLGITALKLHVFEHNNYARVLYEKVGFQSTGRTMMKLI